MRDREQQCFSEFLSDRYRLMAFIRSMVRDSHIAEDIFQEVWLRLDDAIQKGTKIRHTSSWCRGVARNLILHYFRDCKNANLSTDEELLGLVASAFEEQDAEQKYWRAREDALRGCIGKLPQRSSEVLVLRYGKGMSISEVSEQVGHTIVSVTKHLSRIRIKLRECVAKAMSIQGISP